MQETINLIYKDNDLLVFYKPGGLPTVPLKNSQGETFLSLVSNEWPELLSPWGKNPWEGAILHRLDTPTSGLVIGARNKESYNRLINLQNNDLIEKIYIAKTTKRDNLLSGFEPFPYKDEAKLLVQSGFRSYGLKGASVRPVFNKLSDSDRVYSTQIERINDKTFKCIITRGFRHQIRCHLAWSGNPIIGDERYGGVVADSLELEAREISFPSFSGKGRTIIKID